MSVRKRIFVVIAAVLLLLVIALGWLLGTTSGLRFALTRVSAATQGALHVQQANGRLAGPMTLIQISYRGADGLTLHIKRIHLDLSLWSLMIGRLHLRTLQTGAIDVALPDPPAATTKSASSATLQLRAPLHIQLDSADIGPIRVHRSGHDLFVTQHLQIAGTWTSAHLILRQLKLRAPNGHADLEGRLAFGTDYPGHGQLHFAWDTGTTTWAGSVKANNPGGQASINVVLTQPVDARLDLKMTPRSPYPWQAHLVLPQTNANAITRGATSRRIGADLQAHGDRSHVNVKGALVLGKRHLQLHTLQAHLADADRQLVLDGLRLSDPKLQGQLEAQGTLQLDPAPYTARLHLAWNGMTLPAALIGRKMATHGTLDLNGSLDAYTAKLDAQLGPPGMLSSVRAAAHGSTHQVVLDSLKVIQAHGSLDAQGTLDLSPATTWKLDLQAKNFNPGSALAGWPGALDAKLSSSGHIGPKGTRASLAIEKLSGTLRHRPIQGKGTLKLSQARVLHGDLSLRSENSRIQLHAANGTRNDITVKLAIAQLGSWNPKARGALDGTVHARGKWPHLALAADLHGQQLTWGRNQASQLDLHVDVPDIQATGGTLRLQAQKIDAAGFTFASVDLSGSGNRKQHHLTVKAKGAPLSLDMALTGGMRGTAWQGSLSRFTLDLADAASSHWTLHAPVPLHWDQGGARIGSTCLGSGAAQLCLQGQWQSGGRLALHYRMQALPLELLPALAFNDLRMHASGVLDGKGDITRSPGGILAGKATLHSSQGAIRYADQPGQPLLRYRNLVASLDMNQAKQHLHITAGLQKNGHLDAQIRVHGANRALDGHVAVNLDSLKFVQLFTSEVAGVQGQLSAGIDLSGSINKPGVKGQAKLEDVAAEIPALGLKLDQGRLDMRTKDLHSVTLDGHVRSGKGVLHVSGMLDLADLSATDIQLKGKQVQVADIPSAHVSISPDLSITRSSGILVIGGSLDVDQAEVQLEKLPGAGATQASPDVEVVDARAPGKSSKSIQIRANVQVNLGTKTHVHGYGLDGNLSGGLRVMQKPGKSPMGQGQIRVNGSYKAYGQDLSIKQGQLLFASSPLANPGLDIRAVRRINPNATVNDGQVVGLHIRGTAQNPTVNVFSNPAMDQSDALSYLVTGKPISDVRNGQGSKVNAAAMALGSATGNLLAKGIGSRLGISDIGVSGNNALGTTAFTVGKYLSPRLYLSYGVGLFQPGQVITLRYILAQHWNFEAEQATGFSRASFNYRYEH